MPYRNLNDETLVMLTLAGQQNAYEALVKRHQKAVIASAFSVTGNSFIAEDSAQDAFVTAWMKLDKLNEPEKFGAWVCRIAKNCGVNTVRRYKGFMSIEAVENYDLDQEPSPHDIYEKSQDENQLRKSIERLPEKVRLIINLHYFEGLSIVEIAKRLSISQGTVKSQLHDGRKRIRKELCAMNEKWNDTLVEKVMKKVAELKLWQYKNSKDGFETVYNDVLKDVEELPESDKKYHALADVLMRGWWWLPGDKNDALFQRIKEAAELGHNDDVMEFIVTREEQRIPYYNTSGRIDFILNTQIPYLEKNKFTKALARQWFWLGTYYSKENKDEECLKAYEKSMTVAGPSELYYALAKNAACLQDTANKYKEKFENAYKISNIATCLKYQNGALCHWNAEETHLGYISSIDSNICRIMKCAAYCDGKYFDSKLAPGETLTGSDGTTLTFAGEGEAVDCPAGNFEGCQLWITKYCDKYLGTYIYKVYYKEGIGIVKYTLQNCGFSDTRVLSGYNIVGGKGLLPMAMGNTWSYASEYRPDCISQSLELKVIYADNDRVNISTSSVVERLAYDESSWIDMIDKVRNEYARSKGDEDWLCDVSDAIEKAEELAKTPIEKIHTRVAATVMKRIMDTDAKFNPDRTAEGYWNFFEKLVIEKSKENVKSKSHYRWSFEWKNWCYGVESLNCNHIYSILQDAGKYLWSDEWKIGTDDIIEYSFYGDPLKIKISCTEGGTVTTKAGEFENCMKVSFNISGMDAGHSYRGGDKEYYFAEGIGIVKAVNFLENFSTAVYELSSYMGKGSGYMPFEDGLVRKYESVGFTDGFYAYSEYTYAEDENGDLVIFSDMCGIKNILPAVTHYSAIKDEMTEEELWTAKEYDKSRQLHKVNSFKLLLHCLGRPSRAWAAPETAVAFYKSSIRTLEGLSEDGSIPEAWKGYYYSQHFRTGCALFGCGRKEEGYQYLEKAFELYSAEWEKLPEGYLMDVGDELLYGGIKVAKGKGFIVLPDGKQEAIDYSYLFNPKAETMYYGMTAKHGWEWFNSVREEERFKQYIQRAKELIESIKA